MKKKSNFSKVTKLTCHLSDENDAYFKNTDLSHQPFTEHLLYSTHVSVQGCEELNIFIYKYLCSLEV